MSYNIIFLLEEPSINMVLEKILPKLIPLVSRRFSCSRKSL